jgi:hypothetical protein
MNDVRVALEAPFFGSGWRSSLGESPLVRTRLMPGPIRWKSCEPAVADREAVRRSAFSANLLPVQAGLCEAGPTLPFTVFAVAVSQCP